MLWKASSWWGLRMAVICAGVVCVVIAAFVLPDGVTRRCSVPWIVGGLSAGRRDRPACNTSLSQSRGFFCEDAATWALRRAVYERQQPRQVLTARDAYIASSGSWWQDNYEPDFSCALEERIGRPGDGGKWVCDPYRVAELSLIKKCVVYSVGSNNDFSFETSILKRLPKCEVHTFDHTIEVRNVPDGVNFHGWGLGPQDSGKVKTLSTITKKLGHDSADHSLEILKVDIEGAEWDVFLPLLQRKELGGVRQLLIELHPRQASEVRALFSLLHDQGWVITHKEANVLQQGKLVEYAFLNLGWPPAPSKKASEKA